MNKHLVERFIPDAYTALKNNAVIYKDGKISNTLKANIASFGASVQMGSLLAAVAFFSQQGGADQPRQELLNIIFQILRKQEEIPEEYENLFDYICKVHTARVKELVISAAVAVKLAMNLFELDKGKTEEKDKGGGNDKNEIK